MPTRPPTPGVARPDRLSDEGLRRLQAQLDSGAPIAKPVLAQWVRRYGEPARALIDAAGLDVSGLEVGAPEDTGGGPR